MAAHERFAPPTPNRIKTLRHGFALVWIFGGALYFYVHLTWRLILENTAAIEALGNRLRELLTFG